MKLFATLLLTTALSSTAFAQALEVTPTGVAYGNSGTRTEFKDNAGQMGGRSGFFETANPNPASSWYPGASNWQHLIEARHSNTGNNFSLQIAGSFFDQNLWFRKTGNDASAGWSKFVAQNSAGNVGIGMENPQRRLHVSGSIKSDKFELDSNQESPNSFLTISTGGYVDFQSPGFDVISFGPNPALLSGASWEHFKIFRDVGGNVGLQTTGTSTFAVNGGNVGVGINNPDRKLRVLGNAAFGNTAYDYHAQGGNWNYTVILDGLENTSIGFHDAGHSVSSIRYNGNGFTIGGNDGWGVKNVYMPGNVGIGTLNTTHTLTVNGQVKSRGFITDNGGWSDYVFAEDYKLASLEAVEAHIKEKRHLPGVPSEAEVLSKGLDLGQMSAVQMAKIEELMLHVIALNKKMEAQAEQVKAQAEEIRLLKSARKE